MQFISSYLAGFVPAADPPSPDRPISADVPRGYIPAFFRRAKHRARPLRSQRRGISWLRPVTGTRAFLFFFGVFLFCFRFFTSRHLLARVVLFATSALCFSALAWAEDYVVIANKSVASASISRADMQAIFLGDKTKWDDGKPAGFAVMEDGDSHKAFMQDVMSKTPAQFDNYWKCLVFFCLFLVFFLFC